VPQHVRVHPRQPRWGAGRPVHGPAYRGRQRNEDDLPPLSQLPRTRGPVVAGLAEVIDVGADGLEDLQSEPSE